MSAADNTPIMVSVICPCYCHELYLRQALDSILMQEVSFPIEILVGEDCSPDHSREILQEYEFKYPDLFRMFYWQTNLGATKNTYKLQMQARGKYIITLETDDYWTDPLKLQKQVDFLESHPEYIGCGHVYQRVDEVGNFLQLDGKVFAGKVFMLSDFLAGSMIQTATVMMHNFFLDGGNYDIIVKAHPTVGDFTIMSILLQRGNLYILDECMSAYRYRTQVSDSSYSAWESHHRAEAITKLINMLFMLTEYFQGKVDYQPRIQPQINRYCAQWLRGDPGFTTVEMRRLWKMVTPKVRLGVILFIIGAPIRKLKFRFGH